MTLTFPASPSPGSAVRHISSEVCTVSPSRHGATLPPPRRQRPKSGAPWRLDGLSFDDARAGSTCADGARRGYVKSGACGGFLTCRKSLHIAGVEPPQGIQATEFAGDFNHGMEVARWFAVNEGNAMRPTSNDERMSTWVVDYSAARARAIAWLGDRYLLAKPVKRLPVTASVQSTFFAAAREPSSRTRN